MTIVNMYNFKLGMNLDEFLVLAEITTKAIIMEDSNTKHSWGNENCINA